MTTDRHASEHPGFEWDQTVLRAQRPALRALEIACAGHHNLALIGPPGSGKTLLALRTARLLERTPAYPGTVPLRAPHHTVSIPTMLGAGDPDRPGETARAHEGVLVLDEIDEFPRTVLEALREPLKDGVVTNATARDVTRVPARFLLVATLVATPRAQARVETALDEHLHLKVATSPYNAQADRLPLEPEARIRERIARAHHAQRERSGTLNQHGEADALKATVDADAGSLLSCAESATRFGDTETTVRVARTIADLDGKTAIHAGHVAEALSYRRWPTQPYATRTASGHPGSIP